MATSTRYVGTCPVCEGRIKVRGGTLVHHGYRRPGFGHIVGDCFAVRHAPQEVSPATAEAYRKWMTLHIAELEADKARIEKAVELTHTYKGFGETKVVTIKRGDERTYGNPSFPSFDDLKAALLREISARIQGCHAEVARMTRLIDGWVESALTTVEEEIQRVTAEKTAAREAKKAERGAKNATQSARKAEREAKLGAQIAAVTVTARALLDAVDPTSVWAVRHAYLEVLEIKLPASVSPYDFVEHYLDRKDLLASVGLIRPNGRPVSRSETRDLLANR